MQTSFYEWEYAVKKKQARWDVFLNQIEQIILLPSLAQVISPDYPNTCNRVCPPIGSNRMLRMYIAQQRFALTDVIGTSTSSGRHFFHVMASLAEMERELIAEHTRAGLYVARRLGRKGDSNPS